MVNPKAFTGRHETGSSACVEAAAARHLAAEELEAVRDPATVERLLALGAPPQYARVKRLSFERAPGPCFAFVAPRWLVVVDDALATPKTSRLLEAVQMFRKAAELRAAVVAIADLSTSKKAARVAVRRFVGEELARWSENTTK